MKKEYIYPLLIIISIAAAILCLRSCNLQKQEAEKYKEAFENAKKLHPAQPLVASVKKDNYGHQHFTVKPVILSKTDKILTSGFLPKSVVDSLKNALIIKEKNILSLSRYTAFLETKLKASVIADSTGTITNAVYKDSTFNISYTYAKQEFDLKANITLNSIDYKKRKSFFHRYEYFTDTWAMDKRIQLSNIYRISKVLNTIPPKYNLSIGAGASLNAKLRVQPVIYLGISRTILSLW